MTIKQQPMLVMSYGLKGSMQCVAVHLHHKNHVMVLRCVSAGA